MAWEVNLKRYKRGCYWARSTISRKTWPRQWHWVQAGNLRKRGIQTYKFSGKTWKVNWKKRRGKSVWGRNPQSKMPSARKWHWIQYHALVRQGIKWIPKTIHTGCFRDANGYMRLTAKFLSKDELHYCRKHNLLMHPPSARTNHVLEHRLVACKKFGRLGKREIVRHLNGIKDDNRPSNLVVGTSAQNTSDHNGARMNAMKWRNKYISLWKAVKTVCTQETAEMIRQALNA